MKLTVQKSALYEAISKAERIAGKNLSLPVLRCSLLEVKTNELVIRATNLDLGLEVRVPAVVEDGGSVAVPADVCAAFLSVNPTQGSVALSVDGARLLLETAQGKTSIATQPSDDFPTLPAPAKQELFTVLGKEFAQALRSVWWGASTSSIKPELSSVFVYGNGDQVVCVATDSFRLAEKKVRAKTGKGFESFLVPVKNVPELVRHLEAAEGDVVVCGDTHQVAVSINDTYLTTRIIDGAFPDYKQIIPKEFETEVVLLKQDLQDGLKQLRVFSDQFNKITVSVDPKAKTCGLRATNGDVGDGALFLDAAVQGAPLEMHFNHTYLQDVLPVLGADSVVLQFSGPGKPTLVRPVGDQSLTYVVMPMNR